jgi:flagellar assembly protein FliH
MLCRIIDGDDGQAQAFHWGNRAPAPSVPQPPAQAADGDAALWKRRLEEYERQAAAKAQEQRQAGYREGLAEGERRGAASVEPAVRQLAAAIEQLATLRGRLRQAAEADVVKLALAIARRILRRELSLDPGALEALVRHSLEKLNLRDLARVRVHPDHLAMLRNLMAERRVASLAVEPDASLAPGSVIFETPLGTLDASIESQLAEIERGLTDRLFR